MKSKVNFYSLNEQLSNNVYLNKLYLNKNVYYKYLIRTKKTKLYLIDNSFTLHNTIKLPALIRSKNSVTGYSLELEDYFFSCEDYSQISFVLPSGEFHQRLKTKGSSRVEVFSSNFKLLFRLKKKKKLKHVIVLKPVKAGFSVFTTGISGFLICKVYRDYLFRFKKPFFLQRLLFRSKIKQYTIVWCSLLMVNISILYSYKRKALRPWPEFRLFHPVNIIFVVPYLRRRSDKRTLRRYLKRGRRKIYAVKKKNFLC